MTSSPCRQFTGVFSEMANSKQHEIGQGWLIAAPLLRVPRPFDHLEDDSRGPIWRRQLLTSSDQTHHAEVQWAGVRIE